MNDREMIADLLSALEYHVEQTRPVHSSTTAIKAAREHLRKPEAPQPVAVPGKRERDACAEGADFELWWAEHLPSSLQGDAWAEWCAIRSNSKDHLPQPVAVPAGTRALIEQCRAALAEELAAWDIDPPLHHVKQAHDACVAWLAAAPAAPAKGEPT